MDGHANCADQSARMHGSGVPAHENHGWRHLVLRGLDALAGWRERAAQRRRLGELTDHMLRDIGVDRATARSESAKSFWRS